MLKSNAWVMVDGSTVTAAENGQITRLAVVSMLI